MMEKPVHEQQKANQAKITKKESEAAATVKPLLIPIEQKRGNLTKIIKKEPEAAARMKPPLIIASLEQKQESQSKMTNPITDSKAAAKEENQTKDSNSKPPIWDCGSSLYDSFELKSFERQLDSAIHSRTLSMPHLADRRVIIHHPPQPSQPQPTSKKSSKFSRSFQKLLRSVFKTKAQNSNNSPVFTPKEQQAGQDGFYVVYDRSGFLSTIPEVPEFDGLSPEMKSLVGRTASDRFTFTSIGISCA